MPDARAVTFLRRVFGRKRRMRRALTDIGTVCSNYTRWDCVRAGRDRHAKYGADRWCNQCIARDGLYG